jgi:hypothetical protein
VLNRIAEVERKIDVVVNNVGVIIVGTWGPYPELRTWLTFEKVPSYACS